MTIHLPPSTAPNVALRSNDVTIGQPQSPPKMASSAQSLAQTMNTVRDAALNQAVLKKLAAAILHGRASSAGIPDDAAVGRHLATLLRPAPEMGVEEKPFRPTAEQPCVPIKMRVQILGWDRIDMPEYAWAAPQIGDAAAPAPEMPPRQAITTSPSPLAVTMETVSVDTVSVDTVSLDTVSLDTVSLDTVSLDTVSAETVSPAEQPDEMTRMRELWSEHVSWVLPPDPARIPGGSQADAPPPSMLVLEFAAGYLQKHPTVEPQAFFLPFHQFAQRDIEIPPLAGQALSRGLLPFETFVDLAAACALELPPRTRDQPAMANGVQDWTAFSWWEKNLAAICSPMALALQENGLLTSHTLLEWTGLDKELAGLHRGQDTPSNAAVIANPVAFLLASLGKFDPEADPAQCAHLLQNPEILRTMADNHVPLFFIHHLLWNSTKVDWPALEAEMRRVADQYGQSSPFSGPRDQQALQRAHYYKPHYTPWEQKQIYGANMSRHLTSVKLMEPHVSIERLRSTGRLDFWTVSKRGGIWEDGELYFEFHPGRELLRDWTAQGVAPDQQRWMATVVAQGFDEAWARGIIQAHAADPSRLSSWCPIKGGRGVEDLRCRPDEAMKAAIARWLKNPDICPDLIGTLPHMVGSGLGVDAIERLMRYPNRLYAVFTSHCHVPFYIRYGLITPDQLCSLIEGDTRLGELGDTFSTTLFEELKNISELRRKAGDTRDHLRRSLHAIENVRTALDADSPLAQQCVRLGDAWREAIRVFDDLLQPSLDERIDRHPEEIADTLTWLGANLAFQMTHPPEDTGGAAPLQRA